LSILKVSFVDILSEYGISQAPEGHHHRTPNRIQIDCPLCSPNSGHYRLGFNVLTNRLSCWSCGSVDLYGTLQTLLSVDNATAGRLARELRQSDKPLPEESTKPRGKLVIPDNVGPLLLEHRKYLIKRGFDPDELVEIWGIKGIGIDSKLPWRIWIPITKSGQTVSWTTRSISDHGTRYKTARPEQEQINHKDLLFGIDYCKHAVIINEGPLDTMAIGKGAVALFGLQFSQAQVLQLSKFSKRIICMDSEPKAQQVARQLADALETFPGTTFVVQLNDGKDAASTSKKELKEIRKMLK
jgi:hypothetical protein